MHLVDTHAHFGSPGAARRLLDRAADAGVVAVLAVGIDAASTAAAVRLAGEDGRVRASAGLHPHYARAWQPELEQKLRQGALRPEVVAVGECGLDFYRDLSPRPVQRRVFRHQIALAQSVGKPLIIHDREAHQEVLAILRSEGADRVGGVLHCFSGDWTHAEQCLELGFHISLAGTVTYPRATTLQEVARRVPADRLLLETDSPYLTPQPLRGQRNEPANVALVAEKVAAIRDISISELACLTTANARRLFCPDGQWIGDE